MGARTVNNDLVTLTYNLITDPAFWIGGIVIPLIALAFLAIGGAITRAWNNILQFFQSSETPGPLPTAPGPSPFQSLATCLWALILLIALIAALSALVVWVAG